MVVVGTKLWRYTECNSILWPNKNVSNRRLCRQGEEGLWNVLHWLPYVKMERFSYRSSFALISSQEAHFVLPPTDTSIWKAITFVMLFGHLSHHHCCQCRFTMWSSSLETICNHSRAESIVLLPLAYTRNWTHLSFLFYKFKVSGDNYRKLAKSYHNNYFVSLLSLLSRININ